MPDSQVETKGTQQDAMGALVAMLTEQQVSQQLGVAVHTLRCWRSSGKGPAYVKIGRNVQYRPSSLGRWVEDQEREPGDRNDGNQMPAGTAHPGRKLALQD